LAEGQLGRARSGAPVFGEANLVQIPAPVVSDDPAV
jgi:hypothetical protein